MSIAVQHRPVHIATEHLVDPEALKASELRDPKELLDLYRSSFENAHAEQNLFGAQMPSSFHVETPLEAFEAHQPEKSSMYFEEASQGNTKPEHARPAHTKANLLKQQYPQMAEKLANIQAQQQKYLHNMLGEDFEKGNMADFVGRGMFYEDVLFDQMQKIAKDAGQELFEEMEKAHKSSTGSQTTLNEQARRAGGAVGATLGGYFGGPAGAAVGQELGDRLAGSTIGQTPEMRQLQLQKITKMSNDLNTSMTLISNVMNSNTRTAQLIAGNVKC